MALAAISHQNDLLIPPSAPRRWAFQAMKNEAQAGYLLENYEPITLTEMDGVSLMRRVDTKFVLHVAQLFNALSGLQEHYRVLQVAGHRINNYHNLYFDTPEFKLYHQHHNGSGNRYKVRLRQYVDSATTFLEVKRKDNRGQTIKQRMQTADSIHALDSTQLAFLKKSYPYDARKLHPMISNDFMRITMVSKTSIERLTLDINLRNSKDWQQTSLPYLAIAEVKQAHFSLASTFMQQMRDMNIAPQRFSKYCLGITELYPQIKQNRFKPRNLMVERIMEQGVKYGYAG